MLGPDIPSPQAAPEPPPPPPPVPMPDPEDPALKNARKKKSAEIMARGGRLSTILSDQSGVDKLGG